MILNSLLLIFPLLDYSSVYLLLVYFSYFFPTKQSGVRNDISLILAGVYIKRCNINLKKEISLLSLSPCQFKMFEKNKTLEENGLEVLDSHTNHKTKSMLLEANSDTYMNLSDWSTHEEVAAALSFESLGSEDEKISPQSGSRKGLQSLLQAWFLAHLDVINSNTGTEVDSLVLGNETLLHFNMTGDKFRTLGKFQASSNGSLKNRSKDRKLSVEILYILAISEESQHSGKFNAYELSFSEENKRKNNLGSLVSVVGNLHLGEPVSLYCIKERSAKGFSLTASSLSWIGTAASDIINSRYFHL